MTKMPRKLPVFEGYTVDARLREFRKVERERGRIEFIPFRSPKGEKILERMRAAGR